MPVGLVLAALAGVSDLIGSAVVIAGRRTSSRWFEYLLAYGTGFVLAIAVAELISSGLEASGANAIWVLAGFSTLYLVDRLFEAEDDAARATETSVVSGLGLTIVGVAICDFFDGLAVASVVGGAAAAAATSAAAAGGDEAEVQSAWLLLLGLFPHNFLEGAGIALLLIRAGLARGAIWGLVILLAVASLIGGFAVQMAVAPGVRAAIQAFAGGLLLHLVASQRIPEFSGPHAKPQALLVVAGIASFIATAALLDWLGLD